MKYLKIYTLIAVLAMFSCKTTQQVTTLNKPEVVDTASVQGGMWIPSLL